MEMSSLGIPVVVVVAYRNGCLHEFPIVEFMWLLKQGFSLVFVTPSLFLQWTLWAKALTVLCLEFDGVYANKRRLKQSL